MTITVDEQTERAEQLERLRALVDEGFANAHATAPMAVLRDAVASCEAQKKFYADCGFVDASAQG
jgi:hypothetical protein